MLSIISQFFSNLLNFSGNSNKKNCNTLRLVHVIFRHGKRTGIPSSSYPNDPYLCYEYPPYGLANLTKEGKLGCYKMGKELRKTYDTFLGKDYLPDIVVPISSVKTRCQASLLAVLAGLFPPNCNESFEKDFKWQPIPYSVPFEDQDEIFFKYGHPVFEKAYSQLQKHCQHKSILNAYQFLFDYTTEHTGKRITTIRDLFFLYDNFLVQYEFGLKLPIWAYKIFPCPLKEVALLVYYECTCNLRMRKITVGYMLEKILNEMKSRVDGTLTKNTKIFLYSGHDVNVMNLLLVLGYDDVEIPPYSSYVVLELHEIDNNYYVRLLYQNYSCRDPQVIKMLGEEYCPFDLFICCINKSLSKDEDD